VKPHLELKLLERNRCRLRLLDLLHLRRSPDVLPSLLSHPVETMSGPSKAHCTDISNGLCGTINVLLVDQAGVEPASRMPSL
jgi:hypothetical protein